MLLLATVAALAAEPTAGVHAVGSQRNDGLAGGAGGSVGLNLRHVDLELAADLAFGPGALGLVRPQVRLLPWGPERPSPHLIAGGGVLFTGDGDDGALAVGIGADLARTPWRPRVQVLGHAMRDGSAGVLLTLGVAHRPDRQAPDVLPPPTFDAAMVWVPGPVCQWLPPDEASDAFASVDADAAQVNTVVRPPVSTGGDVEAAGPTGDLVVAAWPGDVVTVGDERIELAADGIGWSNLPEGPATVRVQGGGRRDVYDIAISADATLWLTVTEVEPVELRFELGSAELEGPSAATLDAFADTLGDWHVRIWGSYSTEGDPVANEALALKRAQSARDRLLTAGIASEQVEVLPPRTPEDALSPEEQRVAMLEPVPPEAP